MITSIDTDGNIRRIASPYSMKPFLEHLNMTSTDVDETIRFLLTAMPEFSIRGEGGGEKAQRWVHIAVSYTHLTLPTICSV